MYTLRTLPNGRTVHLVDVESDQSEYGRPTRERRRSEVLGREYEGQVRPQLQQALIYRQMRKTMSFSESAPTR